MLPNRFRRSRPKPRALALSRTNWNPDSHLPRWRLIWAIGRVLEAIWRRCERKRQPAASGSLQSRLLETSRLCCQALLSLEPPPPVRNPERSTAAAAVPRAWPRLLACLAQERADEAVSELPGWYFTPFSKQVSTGLIFSYGGLMGGRGCLNWQKPTPSAPIALPDAIYPPTPTLALTGDLDRRVPYALVSKVAALFPNSTLVSVTEAGHETVNWGQCPIYLASGFIETLSVPDTTCAKSPETVWPSVGRFPLYAKDARPAQPDSSGTNQIGVQEEKVVSVAVATAVDAIQRSERTPWI